MSYTLKIGKGKGRSFSLPFGMQQGCVLPRNKNLTIEQYAKVLAEQLEIKNGTIMINSVNFVYTKRNEEQ